MNCQDEESYVKEQFIFLFWNIWLVSDVTWFDSLQTAVTASTENRKQAQEQNQEQQRNLINLQHDLSQVGAKLGYSTCSRNDHRESNNQESTTSKWGILKISSKREMLVWINFYDLQISRLIFVSWLNLSVMTWAVKCFYFSRLMLFWKRGKHSLNISKSSSMRQKAN